MVCCASTLAFSGMSKMSFGVYSIAVEAQSRETEGCRRVRLVIVGCDVVYVAYRHNNA